MPWNYFDVRCRKSAIGTTFAKKGFLCWFQGFLAGWLPKVLLHLPIRNQKHLI